MGKGANRSDRVGRDLHADLIASQSGEAWYPVHSVQHLHLAVPRLDLEAGRPERPGYATSAALSAATTRSGSKGASAVIDPPAAREPQNGTARFDREPDSCSGSQPAMNRDPRGIVPRRRLSARGIRFDRVGSHDGFNDDAAPDGNRSRAWALVVGAAARDGGHSARKLLSVTSASRAVGAVKTRAGGPAAPAHPRRAKRSSA